MGSQPVRNSNSIPILTSTLSLSKEKGKATATSFGEQIELQVRAGLLPGRSSLWLRPHPPGIEMATRWPLHRKKDEEESKIIPRRTGTAAVQAPIHLETSGLVGSLALSNQPKRSRSLNSKKAEWCSSGCNEVEDQEENRQFRSKVSLKWYLIL